MGRAHAHIRAATTSMPVPLLLGAPTGGLAISVPLLQAQRSSDETIVPAQGAYRPTRRSRAQKIAKREDKRRYARELTLYAPRCFCRSSCSVRTSPHRIEAGLSQRRCTLTKTLSHTHANLQDSVEPQVGWSEWPASSPPFKRTTTTATPTTRRASWTNHRHDHHHEGASHTLHIAPQVRAHFTDKRERWV